MSSLSLPKLNDVTTDLIDPPAYSRSRQALAARGGWTPPDASPETRAAQKAAYPRVAPFLLDVPAAEAFALAGRTAEALGWRIVERTPPGGRQGAGRIEAIERSAVLRFPDHIAIRVRPLPNGARLDVRSVSRVGEHDLGTNAARIERFLAAAAADLEAQSLRERR